MNNTESNLINLMITLRVLPMLLCLFPLQNFPNGFHVEIFTLWGCYAV